MDETFELPVRFKGEELLLPASLKQHGYTHRFEVYVGDEVVYFEPDEEGSYRAVVDATQNNLSIAYDLLEAIAQSIEEVIR